MSESLHELAAALKREGADRDMALVEIAILFKGLTGEPERKKLLEQLSEASGIPFKTLWKDLEAALTASKGKKGEPPGLHIQTFKLINTFTKALERSVEQREKEPTDLKVLKVVKLDTREALWDITFSTKGQNYTVRCNTDTHMSIRKFTNLCREEHSLVLDAIFESEWRKLLRDAPVDVVKIESEEATTRGYLKTAILQFEEQARPEKSADVALIVAPVRLDTGEIVVRLPVLMRYLKTEGIEGRTRPEVIALLRELGYADVLRRVGSVPARLWCRTPPSAVQQNGKHPADGQSKEGST